MENIIIMYSTKIQSFLIVLLIVCINNFSIYAQSNYRDKTIIQNYNIGEPLDTLFFQRLEPILIKEKMCNYKVYEIVMIHKKEDSNKIIFEIRGIKRPINDLYIVKYQNRTYMLDGKLVNILFKEGGALRLEHAAYLAYEDFDSPILTLQYFNNKIQIISKRALFQEENISK